MLLELDGVNAKIDRARIGLRSLESDISVFCAFRRRQMIFDESQPFPPYSRRLDDHPRLPIDYPIRVGEIAYNLRSALDHLVWQLVLGHGGDPGPYNSFPICKSEKQFREARKRGLEGVAEAHCQLIEAFQPFQKEGDIGYHLRMLNTICNIDKHRRLNVVDLHSHTDPSCKEYIVDVCFRDCELEKASRGYGSEIERVMNNNRPPVVLVLLSCLLAVNSVVSQTTTRQGMIRES